MIRCYAENIWYVKKKRKKRKKFLVLFFIIFLISILFSYYRYVVSEHIISICVDYTNSFATEAVNNAVLISLKDEIKYSNLIFIEKNNSGDIVLMNTDSLKINTINREIATITQQNLKERLKIGIDIPVLAFSGISLLSGYGVTLNFNSISISEVVCNFSSKFQSVGINQTLHSIYIDVVCEVNIEIPLNKKTEKSVTSVLISEAVLIGKVPDTYLNGNLFGK